MSEATEAKEVTHVESINDKQTLDERLELLIEDGGFTVKQACDAMGVSKSAYLSRKNKKNAQSGPKMLNIQYTDEAAEPSKHVVVMIGNSDEIMRLLKVAYPGNNND